MALEIFAGAVVSSLVQYFFDKITTCTSHAFTDVEMKLKSLEGSHLKVQSLLDKVDGWEMVTNKPYCDWVGDAMRACYDVEDLTLDVMVELRKEGNGLPYLRNWVLSREIDELQSNLDQVLARAPEGVTPIHKSPIPATTTEPVIVTVKDENFQRQREKEEIVKVLLRSGSSSRNGRVSSGTGGSIISIQGMFGLGKTVLAQAVINDARIQARFEQKYWVPVSGDFNFAKVMTSIASQVQMKWPIEDQAIASMLQGTSVLIVLDDVHGLTRTPEWEMFLSFGLWAFNVIITTRNPKVTRTIVSISSKRIHFLPVVAVPYYLQWMSDKDCQSLIINRAEALSQTVDDPSQQVCRTRQGIALKVAEKFCKGLPLVADVIGFHLSSESEDRWISMLSRNLWDMPEFKEQIFPAFGSDFPGFPKALKHCFYYLSLFPHEFNFTKEDLAQLWVAEGFIQPKIAREPYQYPRLKKIGCDYFDELVSRSIIQIYNPFDQKPQVYRVHEFINRYAQYVSSDVYFRLDKEFVDNHSSVSRGMSPPTDIYATWYKKARHISLLCASIAPSILKDLEKCKALRTLLSLHQQTRIGPLSYKLFLNLQSLRVLSLSGTDICKLPESLGQLKYLHLLNLSRTDIQDLPASVTDLQRLKVLKLTDCPRLLRLPKNTKNLTNLLHLEIDMATLSSMPPKMGKLKNLQTLPVFIAGDEEGYLISELKHMKDLKGLICLKNLENVTDYTEAREAMLSNKSLLRKLELEWEGSSINDSVAEDVLRGLKPHGNLEDLRVAGYDGIKFPAWLSWPGRSLTSICLEECRECIVLPPLGQLQHLRELQIQGLHGVKYVNHQFSRGSGGTTPGFPSLVSLKFQDMKNLETWEGSLANQMPCLRELMIMGCPKLITLPSLDQLPRLESLEISDCPCLQSLPEEGLPQSLKSLVLVGSDLVQHRCQPEQGADWDKIKTVPEVVIDFVQIATSPSR